LLFDEIIVSYAGSPLLANDELTLKRCLSFWSRSVYSQPKRLYPLSARMMLLANPFR